MNTNIFKNTFNKATFSIKKHSPEILVVTGIVGVVSSAVMACRATLKVNDILVDAKDKVDKIHSVLDDESISEKEYSKEDSQKDLAVVYIQTGAKFLKLYGPSIILGAASIGCILKSHDILCKRNVALAAAYTAVDQCFKEYRGRVAERFGDTVEREIRYNTSPVKITEEVVDEETGKLKKSKRTIEVADEASMYARFFEEYTVDEEGNSIKNHCWNNDPELNLMFLKSQQQYANDLLRAKKRLFLNDVYRMLGLPESKAGQVVGWVYDETNPNGDNYVSFGVYSGGSMNYSDFIYGTDGGILLDFNVDGNIWDLM